MKTEVMVIRPGGSVLMDTLEIDDGTFPRGYVAQMLRTDDIEHVNVFWGWPGQDDEPRYRDMFVNGDGIAHGLKQNDKATDIYLNNSRVHRGLPPEMLEALAGPNGIYGTAVLFQEKVWS